MANESTTRSRGTKAAEDITEEAMEKPAATKLVAKDIDPNQYVTVRNGFQGKLIYQSKRTGEVFIWEEFGAEQDMELIELKNAKNSCKRFFTDNWFMFDEQWVIDYLGVGMFYKNALKLDEFDELFTKPAAEVEKVVSKLSEGQKRSVAYRARQLISEGGIDSHKTITTLEKCLGTELIEK